MNVLSSSIEYRYLSDSNGNNEISANNDINEPNDTNANNVFCISPSRITCTQTFLVLSPLISPLICLQFHVKVVLIVFLLAQPPQETNPVKIVTGTFLKLYQTLISPSQGDVCNFSPSCSHFAGQAVESHGIFWGSLMAADRLLRCNPSVHQSYDKYYVGIMNHKFYDPIEDNYILKPIKRIQRRDTLARMKFNAVH